MAEDGSVVVAAAAVYKFLPTTSTPEAVHRGTQLYNFSVSGNRTYFVKDPKTGDFLLVHNK